MAKGEVAQCRGCDAPILWTVTEKGKKMPVDADATEYGKFALIDDPDRKELLAVWFTKAENHKEFWDGTYHDSHYATCPAADSFRKRG